MTFPKARWKEPTAPLEGHRCFPGSVQLYLWTLVNHGGLFCIFVPPHEKGKPLLEFVNHGNLGSPGFAPLRRPEEHS